MAIIGGMKLWPHGRAACRGLGLAVLLLWSTAGGAHAPTAGAAPAQLGPDAPLLTEEAARALENPVPNTEASTTRGQRLYLFLGCRDCHGTDGKALIEVVANATDLTDPGVWLNGTDAGLIFRSIRDGAGLDDATLQDAGCRGIGDLGPGEFRPQPLAGGSAPGRGDGTTVRRDRTGHGHDDRRGDRGEGRRGPPGGLQGIAHRLP